MEAIQSGFRYARPVSGIWAVLAVAVGCLLGCVQANALSAPSTNHAPPRQMIVAVDLSGSRNDRELDADRDLLETIVRSLRPGDEIVLIRVGGAGGQRGLATWTRTFAAFENEDRPTQHEQRQFKARQDDATRDVSTLFKQRPTVKASGTDIRAALYTASDKSKEASGRHTTLVLLSDMIQEADSLNFMRPGGIPGTSWIAAEQKADLIPHLSKVCVSVVGPDVSTPRGVSTRAFWSTYFGAAGALFSNDRYRRTMSQFESLLCSE